MGKMKLSDAPGCIGSPIIRSENHPLCRACGFSNLCSKLASVNAVRLQKALGIPKLSNVTGKKLMSGAEKMTIAELEKPAFEGKRPLSTKGAEVKSGLRHVEQQTLLDCLKGAIPRLHRDHALQSVKPDWVKDLIMVIGDNGGKMKKKDMRDYVEFELGYPRLSAVSVVAAFLNGMTHADLLKETTNNVEVMDEASG